MSLDIGFFRKVEKGQLQFNNDGSFPNVDEDSYEKLYTTSIPATLVDMAKASSFYDLLWGNKGVPLVSDTFLRSIEYNILELMKNSDHYRQYENNPEWGSYEDFVNILLDIIRCCHKYPTSIVKIW